MNAVVYVEYKMTRHIIIQDDDVTRQYRLSMEWLNSQYHNHPTMLKSIPVPELGDYNYDVRHSEQRRERPNGKKVI
jgi:hypothetical protein